MAPSLTVGARAPAFILPSGDGQTVRLADYRGRKVVLYFYPKDDTPGCTKEACSFQALLPQLAHAKAVVLGVSRDPLASHQRFAGKFGLTFPLLSDAQASVCKAYGVYKQKSLYGRIYWGIERTTFVIDEAGRIARVFPKVSVDGHVEAILKILRAAAAPPSGQAPWSPTDARPSLSLGITRRGSRGRGPRDGAESRLAPSAALGTRRASPRPARPGSSDSRAGEAVVRVEGSRRSQRRPASSPARR